ncbi:MAG: hypothetical protein MZV70_69840 [Desulfobacterales bacterium]|nr:hypothetical protein [Desulfobacterales bacterium]
MPDAKAEMTKGQVLYKQAGLKRSAVILNSATTTLQFKRIAKESGIDSWERYFDASNEPDWEKKAMDWLD